jgi:hypothetical protein
MLRNTIVLMIINSFKTCTYNITLRGKWACYQSRICLAYEALEDIL